MRRVIKSKGKMVLAYELGRNSQAEADLIAKGKIRILPDGRYEIFSREAVNGSGEIAEAGDYFKVDSGGFPYPNSRAFFLANHRHLSGDMYEQIPQPFMAWTIEEGMCAEIQYLIEHEGLILDETNPEKYFTAPLWGTMESAAKDAVIVFYDIIRDEEGHITAVSFNFVERGEFNRMYEWII